MEEEAPSTIKYAWPKTRKVRPQTGKVRPS